jgi:hypothetical protein
MQQQEEDNTARTNIPAPKTAAASATAPIAKGAGNKPLPAPMPSKGIPPSAKKHSKAEGQGIFWRLARMEFMEAIFLLLINTLIVFIAGWQLNMSPGQMFEASWTFLAPLHLLVSWAYFMLPIVLTGSSVAMLLLDFGIADAQPEKRLFFSFFMLLSVVLLPLSFVCMILTPAHATLAELLTGQEVRERSLA